MFNSMPYSGPTTVPQPINRESPGANNGDSPETVAYIFFSVSNTTLTSTPAHVLLKLER